jgi:hypothetical protein
LVVDVEDHQDQLCALDVHVQRDDVLWCANPSCGEFLVADVTYVIAIAS